MNAERRAAPPAAPKLPDAHASGSDALHGAVTFGANVLEAPAKVVTLELTQPLPSLSSHRSPSEGANGRRYRQAYLFVQLQAQPLGFLAVNFETEELSAEQLAEALWKAFGGAINAQLTACGAPPMQALSAEGVRADTQASPNLTQVPLVSVVVCTRNRPDDLAVCLAYLTRLTYPLLEVLVVDNASDDDATRQVVAAASARFPFIRYVYEVRPGVAWARNRGLLEAQGEIIAYTDDDAQVTPEWLSHLVAGFEAAPDVACVSGLTLPSELETGAQVHFEQLGVFAQGVERVVHSRRASPLARYPAGAFTYAATVNIAYHRDTLRALGGFQPVLAASGEDVNLYYGLIARGCTMVYEPKAVVSHRHRRDMSALRRQMTNYGLGFVGFLIEALRTHPSFTLSTALRLALTAPAQRESVTALPSELRRARRAGLLRGLPFYLKSWLRLRRTLLTFGRQDRSDTNQLSKQALAQPRRAS